MADDETPTSDGAPGGAGPDATNPYGAAGAPGQYGAAGAPGQHGAAGAPGGQSPGWANHPPAGGAWPPPPNQGWTGQGGWSAGQHAGAWPGSPGGWGGAGPWTPQGSAGWTGSLPPPPPTSTTSRRRQRAVRASLAALAAVAIAAGGLAIGYSTAPSSPSATPAARSGSGSSGSGSSGSGSSGLPYYGEDPGSSSDGSGSGSVSTAAGGPSDAAAIAKDVDPGLVDINTTLSYEGEDAAGTGMVLTSNGEVLTNNHVVEGETSISVTDVGNGRTYAATVVGYNRDDDVAVLQLKDASGLQTVKLGNSSTVKKGEAIVGIGNAGGSGGTPSAAGGSVIALDRSITASDEGSGTTEELHHLIVSNAGIEPGDSGGPLVNTSGEVIGMDTAASADGTFTLEGGVTDEGFSIPIDEALSIAKAIEAGRSSSTVHVGPTAFLGVDADASSSSGTEPSYGYGYGYGGSGSRVSGVEIGAVFSGTPAATAGLAEYDTITSLDGKSVTTADGLTDDILAHKPGQTVKIGYVTPDGQSRTATVTLASGPPQ